MLSVMHQRELRDFTEDFALRAVPVMAYNGDGVLADDSLIALQKCIRDVVASALNNFARRRNARVTINRLPPEVLVMVASFLPYGSLDAASRVCHYWYTSFRADASLWTDIIMSFESGPCWSSEMSCAIERCKGKPRSLEMYFSYASPQMSAVCASASSVIDHLGHLEVWISSTAANYLDALFQTRAPALQTMMIGVHCTGTFQPPRLPDNLFNGEAPHLWSVWLTNVFLSGEPGPALDQVVDFGYFGFKDMFAEELEKVCRLCPRLDRFTVVADESCSDYVPPAFVSPLLRTLRLGFWVPPGILHSIVCANEMRGDFDLRLYRSNMHSLPLAGGSGEKKVHLFFECGSHCNSVSLMTESDSGCIKSGEDMLLTDAVDTLFSGLFVMHLTSLSLPDAALAMLLRMDNTACLHQLECLTIQFSCTPRSPFPHMFTADRDPQFYVAPALRTVRLTAWRGYGSPGAFESVELQAEFVANWLPSAVHTLLLSGVRLVGSKDCLRCQTDEEVEWQSGGNERYLEWEPTWNPEFAVAAALHI